MQCTACHWICCLCCPWVNQHNVDSHILQTPVVRHVKRHDIAMSISLFVMSCQTPARKPRSANEHTVDSGVVSTLVKIVVKWQGIANELEEWFGLPKFRVGRVLWNELCCRRQQGELQPPAVGNHESTSSQQSGCLQKGCPLWATSGLS